MELKTLMEDYYDRARAPQQRRSPTGGRRKRRRSKTLILTLTLVGVFTVALLVYLLFFSDRERTISMEATPIPRFGTFKIRRTARSSRPLSIVFRYASTSLISSR